MTTSEPTALSRSCDDAGTIGWRPPSSPGHRLGSRHPYGAGQPTDLYGRALLSRLRGGEDTESGWRVRDGDGAVHSLDADLDRWLGPCDAPDRTVLNRCTGPVLDIGCGPGRLVAELRSPGVLAVGIDVNDVAVQLTRDRGGAAVRADIFSPVPDRIQWCTLLLLDGNLGIGGDPARLFGRCAELLAPGGQLVLEAEAPGCGHDRGRRRLENTVEAGLWFPWATLDVDAVAAYAATSSLVLRESWSAGGRWFAALTA